MKIIIFFAVLFCLANLSFSQENSTEEQQLSRDENTLILYTLPTCGRCTKTREYLKNNNIKFVEYDIKSDKVSKEKMYEQLYSKTKFKGGSVTMPVIIYKDEISYSIKNLDKFLKTIK